MHFFVAVVLGDTEMQSTSASVNFRGRGYIVTFAKGHLSVVYQRFQ